MKTPMTQKTEAIKTRRLKKADFEVDFVFINEVESFPSAVNPQTVPATLGEMAEVCQGLFFKHSDADFRELLFAAGQTLYRCCRPYEVLTAL